MNLKKHKKWFEMWSETEGQNQILRFLLFVFALAFAPLTALTIHFSSKEPLLISVGHDKTRIIKSKDIETVILKKELERTLRDYMKKRHSWSYKTITKKTKEVLVYIQKKSQKNFLAANKNQIDIARKKKITQKAYVQSIVLKKDKGAVITIDRILDLKGVRPAKEMKFQVRYEFGKRTRQNPEGIYITDEKLIN